MTEYKKKFECYYEMIEQAIDEVLPISDVPFRTVLEAMNYSLAGGGKRIRAVMILAFHELCGGNPKDVLPFACAIEMIHAYSLIHDDLPCMDDDVMRRGKPSCHVQFGEAMALLAGDGLLTHAFSTALGANIAPERILRAVREMSVAAGAEGMLGGQIIDIENEGKELEPDLLNTLHLMKTGALIRVSAKIGCITAGADEEVIQKADCFARCVGLAFQIVDDILDVTSTPDKLGKPIGSDKENQKTTFVTLYGVHRSREIVGELQAEACNAISGTVLDQNSFLRQLAQALTDRKS